MARGPDPKLHDVWRDRVRRQQTSGLTIERFCVQERIARSEFHAWKRRFRLMDSRDQCPALPAPSAFLPVTVRLDERLATNRCRSRPTFPTESACESQRITPVWPADWSARSPQPGPIPEAPDDQPSSFGPSLPSRSGYRSAQRLRRPFRVGDHRLWPGSTLRPLILVCESASGPTRSSIGIVTVWPSGTNVSRPGHVPAPSGYRWCRVDRNDCDSIVADSLGHRPAFRPATQTLSAADPRNSKIDRFPLVVSYKCAIIRP